MPTEIIMTAPLTVREIWRQTKLPKSFFGPEDTYTARCPTCRIAHNTTHRFGYCPEHQKCVSCHLLPWVGEDTMRCENCICNECWEVTADLVESADGALRCKVCRTTSQCDICKRTKPRYMCRQQKKFIKMCGRCTPYHQVQCAFCFSKGYTERASDQLGMYYVVCKECSRAISCLQGKCTPTHQCPKCQKQQAQHEQQQEHDTHPHGPPWVYNPVQFWTPSGIKQRKINRSPRFAGIEIEISYWLNTDANAKLLKDVADKWSSSIVRDGSLPPGGIEINTSPAAGDLLLQQIDEWAEALKKVGAMVNNQCGLHVHVDARDHTIEDLKRLVRYYAFLEPALLRTQPFARVMEPSPVNGRFYCAPCGKEYVKELDKMSAEKSSKIYSQALKQKLFENVYGAQGRPPRREHYAAAKYHAFNLHSYFYKNRKTVESRLHTGTIVPRKLKDWSLLWIAIVDHAYKTPESKLKLEGSVDDAIAELLKIAPSPRCASYIKSRIDDFRGKYDEYDKNRPEKPKKKPLTGIAAVLQSEATALQGEIAQMGAMHFETAEATAPTTVWTNPFTPTQTAGTVMQPENNPWVWTTTMGNTDWLAESIDDEENN